MDTTTIRISDSVSVTIAALSAQQYLRVLSYDDGDGGLKPPTPPEGYSEEQAEQYIESYRKEMDAYRANLATIRIFRAVGLARVIAVEGDLVTQEEKDALKKLYRRYLHNDIDAQDDPRMVGSYIYELLNDHGEQTLLLEADIWLQEHAGLISQERVAEVLKSIRLASQREADSTGAGEDQQQTQSGGQASGDKQPIDGSKRRGKKVGQKPKRIRSAA